MTTRKSLIAVCTALALLTLGALPGSAGTAGDPEITDPAGDANFIGPVAGIEQDTRPASLENADLRAVWFQTAFDTTKVVDPATGEVLAVQYRPTALLINIETEAPIHPTQPEGRRIDYEIPVSLPGCDAFVELRADPASAANDAVTIWAVTPGCGDVGGGSGRPVPEKPTFSGNVTTVHLPFHQFGVTDFFSTGTRISAPSARAAAVLPFVAPTVDMTSAGDGFTVGQDVPADVNCTADPGNPDCQ